jgi:hypothetical protein
MKSLFPLFLFSCFSSVLLAQSPANTIELPKIKFGDVTAGDFAKQSDFEKDSASHAIVLYDKGEYSFRYQDRVGFEVHYFVHQRIKILDQAGAEAATKSIYLKEDRSSEYEEILYIDGFTFVMENNVLKKYKLEKSGIFKEKVTDNVYRTKFTMPNIKPGCIIDIQYERTTDASFSLDTWNFQQIKYPVLWSVLETHIPSYFNYNGVVSGFKKLDYLKQDTEKKIATFLGASQGTSPLYIETINICAMKDLPAINEYTYTTTPKDYLACLHFDLASFDWPYSYPQKIAKTWEVFGEALLTHKRFGEYLGDASFMEADVAKALEKSNGSYEQMMGIFTLVKNTVKWDGDYHLGSDESIKKVYQKKTGNSSGINLLLCAALKARNIDATMLLLSTREHGRIRVIQPSFGAFNHAVVYVVIKDKTYLLDATDPLNIPNLLPKKCLNDKGLRLISAKKTEWVDLVSKERSNKQYLYDIQLDANGNIKGKSTTRFTNYEANEERHFIAKLKNEAEYQAELEKQHAGYKIQSLKLINLDSIQKPFFSREITFELQQKAQVAGDMIYCSFLPFGAITNNPFKASERITPIHFDCLAAEDIVVRLAIPEGYKVEELPKNLSISTAEGALKLTIVFQQKGNIIECVSKFSSNSMMLERTEYQGIREWYNQVIAKHAEQIVLKKL